MQTKQSKQERVGYWRDNETVTVIDEKITDATVEEIVQYANTQGHEYLICDCGNIQTDAFECWDTSDPDNVICPPCSKGITWTGTL